MLIFWRTSMLKPSVIQKDVQRYWNKHNVTDHRNFHKVSESINMMNWRDQSYLYYKDLMPTNNASGKVILDYGCGPGHDLVGFSLNSEPKKLIAMDVSNASIVEAKQRLLLHGKEVEFHEIDVASSFIPLEDRSVDLIHCSGVLHHTENPDVILKEFHRILKENGKIQIMVYNYESIWVHLYVAYEIMINDGSLKNNILRKIGLKQYPKSLTEAFKTTTDGVSCPISRFYKKEEFISLLKNSGLRGVYKGASISIWMEMNRLSKRLQAIADQKLDSISRQFLYDLTFDNRGAPIYNGNVAGIGGCYSAKLA